MKNGETRMFWPPRNAKLKSIMVMTSFGAIMVYHHIQRDPRWRRNFLISISSHKELGSRAHIAFLITWEELYPIQFGRGGCWKGLCAYLSLGGWWVALGSGQGELVTIVVTLGIPTSNSGLATDPVWESGYHTLAFVTMLITLKLLLPVQGF